MPPLKRQASEELIASALELIASVWSPWEYTKVNNCRGWVRYKNKDDGAGFVYEFVPREDPNLNPVQLEGMIEAILESGPPRTDE